MTRSLICAALSVFFLVTAIKLNGHFAWASEGGPPSGDKHSSTGTASPHSAGDATRGEELYNASCVVCHGTRAIGGIGPRLTGNPVLSNDQAFWKIVHEGRHMMPPQKGVVSDQQLADIRAWLKTLK